MTAKVVWRMASMLLALVASVYFVSYASEHMRGLPPISWGGQVWVVFSASILLWTGVIVLGALIWHRLLFDLNCRQIWQISLMLYGIAQFGKYLPGNIGHHIGRVVLAKQAGVPVSSTLQTMLIEIAWSIGIASSIALFAAFFNNNLNKSFGIVLFFFAIAFLAPWAGISLANAFFPNFVRRLTNGGNIALPQFRTMLLVSFLYLISFLAVGLLMDLHARFLYGATTSHFLILTAVFAWSWIAGYVTPGAPAGLGVREAVLVSSLTPIYGASIAVGLTLSLRVVTILGDGLAFLMAMIARRLISVDNKHALDL